MRFGYTIEHSAALRAHEEALAAHEKLFNSGGEATPECEALSHAELAALNSYIALPSTTTMELGAKLKVAVEQQLEMRTDWPEIVAGMRRDLINMARPNVSPRVADAFAAWAEAHRAHCQD